MNPCCKLPLFTGVRYMAVGDFFFTTVAITVITFHLINSAQHGLAINNLNVPVASTSITEVLVTYLIVSLVNLILSIVLYRGIITDNIRQCQTFLIVSTLSTIFGLATAIYHGFHLSELDLSLFNLEFFIFLVYHLFKMYLLLVVGAFVREQIKLEEIDDLSVSNRRLTYQSLASVDGDDEDEGAAVAKHILFNVSFSAKQYIPEEKLTIDYDTFVEYAERTSTVKGRYQQTSDVSSTKDVAIKILKSNLRTEQNMTQLVKEARLMFFIGSHQHILQLLGVCCTSTDISRGNVMLIMQSYPPRRLDDFLRDSFENRLQNFEDMTAKNQNQTEIKKRSRRLGTVYENVPTSFQDLEPFSTLNMIQWSYQVSSAMGYLHSKKIVLGNLRANSIILMQISCVKLTNFGLASELREESNIIPPTQLTGRVSWQWTAVECLNSTSLGLPAEFNEKTDVWSFGSTIYEIFNMGYAPHLSHSLTDYVDALKKGRRPERPQFASEGLYNLMKTCWSQVPSDRPNFKFISLFFRQLLSTSILNTKTSFIQQY